MQHEFAMRERNTERNTGRNTEEVLSYTGPGAAFTNNFVTLTGQVASIELNTQSTQSQVENSVDPIQIQTTFLLSVARLSGMVDHLPIVVGSEIADTLAVGDIVTVRGKFVSFNKIIGDKSKLILQVYAEEVDQCGAGTDMTSVQNPNSITLVGFVCKPPIYRTTPFNREIADLLLAVNRAVNKSDYIPAIAWGRNARLAKGLMVGEKVHIEGRVQSREYQKRLPDDTVETRIAYEVSINHIEKIEN